MSIVVKRNDLTFRFEQSILSFLKKGNFPFNTIFISPAWAEKIYQTYGFEYQWMVFFLDGRISALHLSFTEYRGREKISYLPVFVQKILLPLAKSVAPYKSWKTPLLIDSALPHEENVRIVKSFVEEVRQFKSVRFSPAPDNMYDNLLPFIEWSTYRFDFVNNSYADIYSRYNRSLKRALKKISNNPLYTCKRLDFSSRVEVQNFINWVNVEQKNTGKAFIYQADALMRDKVSFTRYDYIYEVFFLECKDKGFLGSLTLYGDKCFVTEAEANASTVSKDLDIFAHDFLRDAVVRFCLDKGIRFYDLAGFNPNQNITRKEQGIKFAKKKFNAKEVSYLSLNW